jgi:hypothetical protein
MKIYLSGPISGKRNGNRRAFDKVIKIIDKSFLGLGAIKIINPLEIAKIVDLDFSLRNRNRFYTVKPEWKDYMKADLRRLCDADCLYSLKGWEKSKGAVLERHIAEMLEIPCAENAARLQAIYREGKWNEYS